ncbi:bifunctional folylpolyglutamate synthase/dihydrofolate synthase [Candidatus Woesearchaeota archaeon]|nr:bifunctional folylpolyglutamate synthase/dihydrofolate synthase [Candidatus Woesearchaeota archaeon]
MSNTVTYEGIVHYLNSMEFSGMKMGIDRIRDALYLFGNPEKDLKVIHVVGTNGKGSVAAMMSKIIERAGHKVGMFTSPHLVDVRERIQVNNQLISKEEFREVFLEAKSKFTDLTFFELITLMAVLHFSKQKVDYAVFEAGLGGTYDATNFETSLMTVITRISLDHTHILGDTVEKIAKDKCGAIKQNQPVVVTHTNNTVMDLIRQIVDEKESRLVLAEDTSYDVSLKGQFQKENAGIAVMAARELNISDGTIKKALQEVRWPGRVEFIEDNILLDCAHNPAGITALGKYVETLEYDMLYIVFGVSKNKDYDEMIRLLPRHEKLIFTQSSITRRLHIEEVPDSVECIKVRDPAEALSHAKGLAGEKDLILVCGSIFLVGDIKASLSLDSGQDVIA